MSELFEIEGPNLDLGYINLREGKFSQEREIREKLQAMWQTYEPYADTDFALGFARDPEGRFWEMYLGCTLLAASKTLLPRSDRQTTGGQPDICVVNEERRIWIEAIAPDCGTEGPDRVQGPQPINEGGGFGPIPTRQAQLRLTSALLTKSRIVQRYIQSGVIGPDDVRLIAIGGGRIGRFIPEPQLPLIMSSVFPIGDEFVTIAREHGSVIDRGFLSSLKIERQAGSIPRTAFIDDEFSHVSGVIWSRIGIGNMSRRDRPLTLVHNPCPVIPMPQLWGVWDLEFVAKVSEAGWEAENILMYNNG